MINLHPQVVHFPVALVATLFLYEVWCRFRGEDPHQKTVGFLLIFLLIGAAASAATGWWFEKNVSHPHEGVVHDIMEWHETLGFAALGGFALLSVAHFFFHGKKWGRLFYGVLLIALFLGTGLQAYLGGELGHTHGLSLPPDEHPPMHLHHQH